MTGRPKIILDGELLAEEMHGVLGDEGQAGKHGEKSHAGREPTDERPHILAVHEPG